jgi:TonB family protein
MSHVYAARGSRQTAVFTAIAAFHFVVFLVVTLGLVPRVLEKVPIALPITPLAPDEKPIPILEKPDMNLEGFTPEISVAEPVFEIPRFDATETVPDTSIETTGGGDSTTGPLAAALEHVAPRLRTRSGSLAALIGSCYPAASRRLNEEGRVLAQVLIDANGAAVHWSVAQSSGFPRLDEATACVLRKLEFVAGRRDGQAVAAEAMLPIVFRLD